MLHAHRCSLPPVDGWIHSAAALHPSKRYEYENVANVMIVLFTAASAAVGNLVYIPYPYEANGPSVYMYMYLRGEGVLIYQVP